MSGPNFCDPCGFYHPRDYDCAGSRERDAQERRRLTEVQAAYRAGWRACVADMERRTDREWAATPVSRPVIAPALAELTALRWGPGGREHFGDPRPGDYHPLIEQGEAA